MPRVSRANSASPLPIKELQLATLVEEAPEGPEWLHEQKFDGYRILADKQGDRVRLASRRFKDWTGEFPSIAAAIAKLSVDRVVLDGEVCVVMPDGRTSFQALQGSFGTSGANLVYFVFDLLALDDEVLTTLPLEQRKQRLAKLLGKKSGPLRYSDHVVGSGAEFFALACKQGLEGIISKRRDRPYVPGRGKTWLKTKCLLRQELVIGGFTDPEGSRGQGRHRLLDEGSRRAVQVARRDRAGRVAIRSAAGEGADRTAALGCPTAGRRGRVLGMDHRWPTPSSVVPGIAPRQVSPRGRA
jgi:DNA ligase D-like protein (predicted ligase)